MCGINGILNFNNKPVSKEDLFRMNSSMIHRGPDDEGYHLSKNIGLAMRRLSIIDPEGGHQPISNEDGRYWIVLNGEIYNYLELRGELENKGHIFKTRTDTEVIVHLYEDMGEKCLDKLNGMFAFAIWDCYRSELFMVTDRLGIKPLFYFKNNSSFCFSSELKSLMTLGIDKHINYSGLLLYLFLLYIPYPSSIIKEVYKLEPATYLKININGDIIKKSYWNIEKFNTIREIDIKKFSEEFLSVLMDATRLQLRSDVPIGTFLSGGIDSSCVVAMLSRLGATNPVRTFSVGYEGNGIDERAYALKVAEMYATEHRELFLTTEDVKKNLRRIIWFMDEPIGDTAAIPTFLLSEIARDSGVKVILNGTGGDEIFGGYRRYLRRGTKKLNTMTNIIFSGFQKPTFFDTLVKSRDPIIAYCCQVNGNFMGLISFLKDKKWLEVLIDEIINLFSDKFYSPANLPEVDRLMNFDLKTYLVGDLLFLLDKMTMGASIEGRVPLIDHRMVEFMASIPAKLRIENGNLKALVKHALEGILPDEVINRGKMGFGAPVSSWLHNGILDEFSIFDEDASSVTQDLFYSAQLCDVVKNKKYNRWNAQFIYNLAIFELWYKDVFKGK